MQLQTDQWQNMSFFNTICLEFNIFNRILKIIDPWNQVENCFIPIARGRFKVWANTQKDVFFKHLFEISHPHVWAIAMWISRCCLFFFFTFFPPWIPTWEVPNDPILSPMIFQHDRPPSPGTLIHLWPNASENDLSSRFQTCILRLGDVFARGCGRKSVSPFKGKTHGVFPTAEGSRFLFCCLKNCDRHCFFLMLTPWMTPLFLDSIGAIGFCCLFS